MKNVKSTKAEISHVLGRRVDFPGRRPQQKELAKIAKKYCTMAVGHALARCRPPGAAAEIREINSQFSIHKLSINLRQICNFAPDLTRDLHCPAAE